jgi:hypothetical protein
MRRVLCVSEVLASGGAILIVAAITIPFPLIEMDLIEDDAGDAMRLGPQHLEGLGDAGPRGAAPFDD